MKKTILKCATSMAIAVMAVSCVTGPAFDYSEEYVNYHKAAEKYGLVITESENPGFKYVELGRLSENMTPGHTAVTETQKNLIGAESKSVSYGKGIVALTADDMMLLMAQKAKESGADAIIKVMVTPTPVICDNKLYTGYAITGVLVKKD